MGRTQACPGSTAWKAEGAGLRGGESPSVVVGRRIGSDEFRLSFGLVNEICRQPFRSADASPTLAGHLNVSPGVSRIPARNR